MDVRVYIVSNPFISFLKMKISFLLVLIFVLQLKSVFLLLIQILNLFLISFKVCHRRFTFFFPLCMSSVKVSKITVTYGKYSNTGK